ncbi:hypothetical protein Gasu2_21280 [Galdieria sulphuraria]|nr:hypothetical protein Gasu2_21280 [Galdieria sulphuraria]
MPPVTSLFGSSPKTVNLEIEHWMNNLNEVQSVINTVEPKLNTTPTKWKAVFQHVKEVSEELSQIFNKEDPHYDVILAGVNAGRKFDSAQAEIAKSDSFLEENTKNEKRKGKDQPRIERNQQKLKDAEDSYHAVTAEVIQKMETCWKKHVEVFAEASIALWYMQMRMVDEFAQTSEDVRPFVDDYLKNMKSSNTSFPNQDYMGEDASAAKHTKDPLANNDSTLDTDNAFPCLEEDDKQESAPEKYPSIQSLTA